MYVGLKCWVCSNRKDTPPGYLEDWSDLYEISPDGKAREKATGVCLEAYTMYGRKYYNLTRGEKTKKRYVHRCVATSFPGICGEYGEHYEVDHINSDPLDNRAENLRWVSSHSENMRNPATIEKIRRSRERNKQVKVEPPEVVKPVVQPKPKPQKQKERPKRKPKTRGPQGYVRTKAIDLGKYLFL